MLGSAGVRCLLPLLLQGALANHGEQMIYQTPTTAPASCVFSAWSTWSSCSRKCQVSLRRNDTVVDEARINAAGTQFRTREVAIPAAQFVSSSLSTDVPKRGTCDLVSRIEFRECPIGACPQHCDPQSTSKGVFAGNRRDCEIFRRVERGVRCLGPLGADVLSDYETRNDHEYENNAFGRTGNDARACKEEAEEARVFDDEKAIPNKRRQSLQLLKGFEEDF